jgi:hypothetical protein
MDTGAVKRGFFGSLWLSRVHGNSEGRPDRDPGTPQRDPERPAVKTLTADQEAQALDALQERMKQSGHDWKTEWVKAEGFAPHVLVMDASGNVLRRLSYEDMVEIFLTRHQSQDSGILLRRSA